MSESVLPREMSALPGEIILITENRVSMSHDSIIDQDGGFYRDSSC